MHDRQHSPAITHAARSTVLDRSPGPRLARDCLVGALDLPPRRRAIEAVYLKRAALDFLPLARAGVLRTHVVVRRRPTRKHAMALRNEDPYADLGWREEKPRAIPASHWAGPGPVSAVGSAGYGESITRRALELMDGLPHHVGPAGARFVWACASQVPLLRRSSELWEEEHLLALDTDAVAEALRTPTAEAATQPVRSDAPASGCAVEAAALVGDPIVREAASSSQNQAEPVPEALTIELHGRIHKMRKGIPPELRLQVADAVLACLYRRGKTAPRCWQEVAAVFNDAAHDGRAKRKGGSNWVFSSAGGTIESKNASGICAHVEDVLARFRGESAETQGHAETRQHP